MKNLIVGSMVFAIFGFISCNKQEVLPGSNTKTSNQTNSIKAGGPYVKPLLSTRSYYWVPNTNKLDCSTPGSSCVVMSSLAHPDGTIDLSVIQLNALINLGNIALDEYFLSNNLPYEFPFIYEDDFYTKLNTGLLNLVFEFPYLKINNSSGQLQQVYNYESSASNRSVITNLRQRIGQGYTKQAQISNTVDTVWKCIIDGNNCNTTTTTSVRFSSNWLADNPSFMFAPTTENIVSTQVNNESVSIETTTGKHFVMKL